ncbi:PREDICTED: putative gamma-glutamylcyclotransferase At3g02910 [Nelumbo nucifera]|uniref:Gamma-glutamylcyclotransferase family protein n=1 Tax=Nelumbo nucifera TaxID=4432 RepID=A0A1U7YM29_NELNU|nr:PREDICTED: putative gamma-glutamylcyclotransferase At3g02910 [Nelumbo nucifera]
MGADEEHRSLIFTYGTLKRGFFNHNLVQDMIRTGDAVYLGVYRTVESYPLVCGPYRVPFLLNLPGCGERVWGELYAVSAQGLARMDELEGTSRGHYERLPVEVCSASSGVESGDGTIVVGAEAYYAHRSYGEELWKRNGEKGFRRYSEKEASGYVRRKDRPQHLTFLQQIQLFCSHSLPPIPPPPHHHAVALAD